MKNLEQEFKWDANTQRAFYRALETFKTIAHVENEQKLYVQDTYLDHENGQFAKDKIAFRVRCINDKWEATFKTRSEVKNGKAVRREETLQLPASVKNLAQAIAFLQRKKVWKNLDVCHLKKRFLLKNNRRIFAVVYKKCRAELALDNFKIFVCGREVKMREIELELKHGSARDFEALATQFTAKSRLDFAKISKVKTAEMLRALWGKNK